MDNLYEDFLRRYETHDLKEKDLFYVFLEIPEYWEIQAYGLNGKVVNMGKEVAYIYFKEPIEKRNVSRVEWLREDGSVYKVDYFNKYGFLYCTHDLDETGIVMIKTYFTSEHKEVFNVNCSNGTVTLFENGMVTRIFQSEEELRGYITDNTY